MNLSWINTKLAVAECDFGKGQSATRDIARGELLVVFGGCMMLLEKFDLLSET